MVDGLVLLVAIRRSTMSALRRKFPAWTPIAEKVFVEPQRWPGGKPPTYSLSAGFIDNVASVPELGRRLKEMVTAWEQEDLLEDPNTGMLKHK
jgi:hypothetical protein